MPRIATVVNTRKSIAPERVAAYITALGDAGFDYSEGVRGGEDPIRALAGVTGSTLGQIAAFEGASKLLSRSKPGLARAAIPVVAGFAGAIPGGYLADRLDEFIRPNQNASDQTFNNYGSLGINDVSNSGVADNNYIWVNAVPPSSRNYAFSNSNSVYY